MSVNLSQYFQLKLCIFLKLQCTVIKLYKHIKNWIFLEKGFHIFNLMCLVCSLCLKIFISTHINFIFLNQKTQKKKRNEITYYTEDIPTYVASCWSDPSNEKQLFICNNDFMALSPYTDGDSVWVSEWIVKCTSTYLWMFFFCYSF